MGVRIIQEKGWMNLAINSEQIFCQQLSGEVIVKLVKKANEFDSNILAEMNEKRLNAKSILSMAMFNGTKGMMTFHATGEDSKEAVMALRSVFATS